MIFSFKSFAVFIPFHFVNFGQLKSILGSLTLQKLGYKLIKREEWKREQDMSFKILIGSMHMHVLSTFVSQIIFN